MRVHQAALLLAFRLYNDRVDAVYDAIVIGAGAGGCPLTQTLIERGYETLLLERGGERNQNSQNKDTAVNALMNNNCIEEFDSQGVVVATGNCMGGATSYNQGIYIEEPENFLDEFGGLFSPDLVSDAFTYVRNFYAPEATSQTGKAATYTAELIEAMKTVGLTEANVAPGQPNYPTDGANIWRTHSIFEPTTGYRRSADTILDRTNSNLEIRTNSEVEKVLFCGDAGVPTCSDNETATTAKCVQFTSGNIACVRENGKIFLSAGAIHTPRLLIASGIGPHGSKVLNSEVGQNLSDKPGKGVTTFFKPGFDYEEEGYTYGEVAAIQKRTLSSGAEKTLLWEEVSTGPQEMANFLCFEQLVAPRDLRFSAFADEKTGLQEQCKEEIESGRLLGLSRECLPSLAAYSAGCYGSQSTLVSLVADPSSTGSVTVQADGSVVVDVGFLTTAEDQEALGAAVRAAYGIKTSVTGESAPAEPCLGGFGSGLFCPRSCPDLVATSYNMEAREFAEQRGKPRPYRLRAATVHPKIEALVMDSSLDDRALGAALAEDIISPHHIAGTASIGKVVDATLHVVGVENLIVADASVLPQTPKVNSMAMAMMIGRLAGTNTMFD